MKVVILAGGLGTRIPEYSSKIPKPMVKIINKPIFKLLKVELLIEYHFLLYLYLTDLMR